MSLEKNIRDAVFSFCDDHLPDQESVAKMFAFIADNQIRDRVKAEFDAARYIYKLGLGLAVTDQRLHAHTKFQIMQYASIYEVLIVHYLWNAFPTHPAVESIENHMTLRRAATLLTLPPKVPSI